MDLTDGRLVLVGGAGLIGSRVVDHLVREPVREIVVFDNFVRGRRQNLADALLDSRVKVVAGSMTDVAAVREVVHGADGVFLLASLPPSECFNDPRSAWETNVIGSWNVVQACQAAGVQRLVYSSSASVYGNARVTPMTDEHPSDNRTTYGATKIAVEQMCRAMHEQHRLPYVGLRYTDVYGPRMDHHGFSASVILEVLDRIFEHQRPVVPGDGAQTHDFVYIDDVARANVLAMQATCVDHCLDIGSGLGTSMTTLVTLLLELTGADLSIDCGPQEQSFGTERVGSIDLAERLLGFRAATPLREGLERVVTWRRQQLAAGPSASADHQPGTKTPVIVTEPRPTSRSDAQRAFSEVVRAFPFAGYMEPSDVIAPVYHEFAEVVRRYVPEGGRILDFGCGPCDRTAMLQQMGYACTGYDDLADHWQMMPGNRERILEFARGFGVEFVLASNHSLPFQPGSFEMVMLHDVVEHLHDSPRELLNDLVSLLRPGGYLFITVPNALDLKKRLYVLFGRTNYPRFDGFYWYPGPWRGHVREYSLDDLRQLSEYLGVTVRELRGSHSKHMLRKLPGSMRPLYRVITGTRPTLKDGLILVVERPVDWQPRKTLRGEELKTAMQRMSSFRYDADQAS